MIHIPNIKSEIFNINDGFPQVLFVGNGIANYGGTYLSWSEVIKKYAGDKHSVILNDVPYSMQGTLYSETEDNKQHNKYTDTFLNKYSYRDHSLLRRIIEIDCDAFLTTNYTYEIENAVNPKYVNIKSKNNYAFYTGEKSDSRFLMNTFNVVKSESGATKKIWHIHGEARRPSSIVFTHDEYAREIAALVEINKDRKNSYQNKTGKVEFKSWFDYMILSDIYIIGFGIDFSEFDIWWLLNRRKREKASKGNMYFFEPYDDSKKAIYKALEMMDVRVEHCGYGVTHNKDIDKIMFEQFYGKALDEIVKTSASRRKNK